MAMEERKSIFGGWSNAESEPRVEVVAESETHQLSSEQASQVACSRQLEAVLEYNAVNPYDPDENVLHNKIVLNALREIKNFAVKHGIAKDNLDYFARLTFAIDCWLKEKLNPLAEYNTPQNLISVAEGRLKEEIVAETQTVDIFTHLYDREILEEHMTPEEASEVLIEQWFSDTVEPTFRLPERRFERDN